MSQDDWKEMETPPFNSKYGWKHEDTPTLSAVGDNIGESDKWMHQAFDPTTGEVHHTERELETKEEALEHAKEWMEEADL